ncbi:MAG: HEPN domain-containing protein [Bacteroidales bacterium]|nr:HEPN domain-containing protein [Bacteroidales bacterium]
MNESERNEYILYRLEKSFESLADAKLLAQNQRWNASVNRLYFAAFYAVMALLLTENSEGLTHAGTRSQFNLKFIKEGRISKEYGRLYSKLFDWRHKGDYGDLFDFTENQVLPLIEPTENLLLEIKKLIG